MTLICQYLFKSVKKTLYDDKSIHLLKKKSKWDNQIEIATSSIVVFSVIGGMTLEPIFH